MRSFARSLVLIAAFAVVVFAQQATRAPQQKSGDSRNTPKLTLGDSDGSPGGSIVVPIYFAPAEGVAAGEIKLDVSFVSRNLKYSRINRGIAAESGNVDVRAELKEGKNDKGLEISTLRITASIPSPKPGQKGIPAGLLGYLTLLVNEKAGPANITLRTSGEAAELGLDRLDQGVPARPRLDEDPHLPGPFRPGQGDKLDPVLPGRVRPTAGPDQYGSIRALLAGVGRRELIGQEHQRQPNLLVDVALSLDGLLDPGRLVETPVQAREEQRHERERHQHLEQCKAAVSSS